MIEVSSDVGGGKTTLIQGIAAGMGVAEVVSSPTFTLSRVYPAHHDISLHHFDLYRLGGHDVVTDELAEATCDPRAVVAVEWAEHGDAQLPHDRLRIQLTPGVKPESRHLTITSGGPRSARIIRELSQ
jgi:tRNA threonylcarbamoyladenosine biosynthesis protein TsaE